MNEIQVNGTTSIMGCNIPIIEGGFGLGCKVIGVNTIAEVHGIEVRKINELINSNIDEFEKGIDILDLKQDEKSEVLAKDLGLITSNRQKYCYILSEQGYMLLVGFMKTKRAKEIRKQIRREYFQMRENLKQNSEFELLKDIVQQQGKTIESIVTLLKDVKDEVREIKTNKLIENFKTEATETTYKNTTVKNSFNLSRFEAHINNLSDNIKMTKKEYIKIFDFKIKYLFLFV